MLGIYLNLILVSLAVLSLAAGISFFIHENDAGYIRTYTLLFGSTIFLICMGYAVMGFTSNTEHAFIPRFIGVFGIDIFLLLELAFLSKEIKETTYVRIVVVGFFATYVLFDMLIFGKASTLKFIRYELHTAFETINRPAHIFHYTYILAIAVALMVHGVIWYKTKKIKRDKQLVVELILTNYVIAFAAIPDIFKGAFSQKYPTFTYSFAFSFVFFSYWFAIKHNIIYTPALKNVSKEIFYSLVVPVIIFDVDGNILLFNPSAKEHLLIPEDKTVILRNLFTLTDVESMRLLTRSKNGWNGMIHTKIKASGMECSLHCTTRFDRANEPFCIIGTILPDCKNIDQ